MPVEVAAVGSGGIDMEILISIGIFALGVAIGVVVMACMATAGYADTLQDTYDRGYEDGQKSMRV